MFRTSTELQDIQIALLLELHDMIDDTRDPSELDSTYQVMRNWRPKMNRLLFFTRCDCQLLLPQQNKLCSWRKTGSVEAMLYDEMCDKMRAIKSLSAAPAMHGNDEVGSEAGRDSRDTQF